MELWKLVTLQIVRLYLQAMAKSAYLLGYESCCCVEVGDSGFWWMSGAERVEMQWFQKRRQASKSH